MKKLIFSIILAICFTNYISAGEINSNKYKYIQNSANIEKTNISMVQLIEFYLNKSSKMNLTDNQRDKLSNISKKYIYPLTITEAEFKLSRIKVSELVTNPNFNADEVKLEIKNSKNLALEMSLTSVDAINEIREIIGIENFETIMESMKIKY